ncbi:DUF6203 family protein [Nonomuraea sp. NPDC050478]|uniref:DUF6203 family protein n=1 Tax=Nonomuraea sp. NPDC050478 TaxID=3364365 RepID=UPI0037B2A60B
MKGLFKVALARWLARTPIGLAILGAGWFLGRRRSRRKEEQERRRSPLGRRRSARGRRR